MTSNCRNVRAPMRQARSIPIVAAAAVATMVMVTVLVLSAGNGAIGGLGASVRTDPVPTAVGAHGSLALVAVRAATTHRVVSELPMVILGGAALVLVAVLLRSRVERKLSGVVAARSTPSHCRAPPVGLV